MKIKSKKSLGQNFLIDENILNLICSLGNINTKDNVIEIGPGTGNLTNLIKLKKPKKLIVVEKDKKLSELLNNKFSGDITIINDDFLNLNRNFFDYSNLILFGNLPYNISSQILVKLIKVFYKNYKFKKIILMFQKEVADRIIASYNTKNYGRLSVITNLSMEVEKIKDISPNSFRPIPKVISTILCFKPKKKIYKINDIKNLEYITNTFFSFKRKMIKKPLSIVFKESSYVINKLDLDPKIRPQNLEPSNYYRICQEYESSI
tara:strand:- start:1252 stop:2040 length:789 start_codon:yes stop_codon:yes gene_type:complete